MARSADELGAFLASATVHPDVLALRPDYRALLLAVDGIEPGPGDARSEALLAEAERSVREALAGGIAIEGDPHVAAWREAYAAFGAKPKRTRNSLEALMRRAEAGLPRVNRLTDTYNAISVLHRIPLGGEDLDRYAGAPALVRAAGDEPFDTVADGEPLTEHPEPGEVCWRDDAGITCRRWNWRQCRRTGLAEGTTAAVFVLDALGPCDDRALAAAADALAAELAAMGAAVSAARRVLPA